jgi:hypothetical protein
LIRDVFTLKYLALEKWEDENGFIPSNGWLKWHFLSNIECQILGNIGMSYVPVNVDGSVPKSVNSYQSRGWRLVFEGIILTVCLYKQFNT